MPSCAGQPLPSWGGTRAQRKHRAWPMARPSGRLEMRQFRQQSEMLFSTRMNSGSTQVPPGQLDTPHLLSGRERRGERGLSLSIPGASYSCETFPSPATALQELQTQQIYSWASEFREFSRPLNLHSSPRGGTGVSTAVRGDEYRSVRIDLANYSDKNRAQLRVHFLSAVLKSAALNLASSCSIHGSRRQTHDGPVSCQGTYCDLLWPLTNTNLTSFM